jgi:hypothetical protein
MAQTPLVGHSNGTLFFTAWHHHDLMKLHVGVLYLDLKHWKWWKWHKNSHRGYISWTQFVTDIYEHFDTDTHHLGHLTKLK